MAKILTNYENQTSIRWKLRHKRIAPLLTQIKTVFKDNGYVNIVDIGGTREYWGIMSGTFMDKYNVNITIVNLPGTFRPQQGRFKFVPADGCDLSCIEDNAFHIAHSNSVIEHVGDWGRMVQFAGEISRVAPKYFVQTPNYWFPIEPHCMVPFFHWLPKPMRIWLLLRFELGNWKKAESIDAAVRMIERVNLLNKKMLQELFKGAQILTERFLFLPKSFIAVKK